MGKKMKIPSLFKIRDTPPTTRHPWNRASCNHPTTHSFRGDDVFRTLNSVFFDPIAAVTDAIETPESWFTSSSVSASKSMSTEAEEEVSGEEALEEMIIHGARSERLFFEPETTTSSIVEKKTAALGAKGEKEEPSPHCCWKRAWFWLWNRRTLMAIFDDRWWNVMG